MTSPKCRLFLVTPAGMEPDRVCSLIGAALEAGDVASLLIALGPQQKDLVDAVKSIAHKYDVALLIENDHSLAREAGADGVHIPPSMKLYEEARMVLGSQAVIGVGCGTSKHAAMTMADAGADYVAFSGIVSRSDDESVVKWWSELFEIPVVVLDPASEDIAVWLLRQGADFIRPSEAMWQNERRAAAEVSRLNLLIEDCVKC